MPSPTIPLVLDLSHHNIVTDWAKVASSGVRAIIHKATQGTGFVDPRYAQRRTAARAQGLLWGAYHFATSDDAAAQVAHFLQVVGEDPQCLLALDWEPNTTRGQGTMSLEQARLFLELVAARTGQKPVLYSGHLLKEQVPRGDAFLSEHRLWLAHYTSAPAPRLPAGFSRCFLWQYTDGSASAPPAPAIPGIESQGVDCNHYAGSVEQLSAEWVVSAVPAWEEDEAVANVRARVEAASVVTGTPPGQSISITVSGAPLPGPHPLPGERAKTNAKSDENYARPMQDPVAPPALQPAEAWGAEVLREATKNPEAAAAQPAGFWSILRRSKSLKLLLTAGGGLIADWLGYLRDWLDAGWDLVLWTMGVLPDLTAETRTTLTSAEEAARWFKVDWGAVLPKVALVVAVIVFLRHLADKRELEALKKGQEPQGS
jgi:lysozyme